MIPVLVEVLGVPMTNYGLNEASKALTAALAAAVLQPGVK